MSRVSQITEVVKQPKLLDLVRAAIRSRHYSYLTEQTSIHWIRRYILFHNKRCLRENGEKEINEFITHLAKYRKKMFNIRAP